MSRFLRDVRDGNLAAVQRHLTTNPSAARATEPGTEQTPLHIAASCQHAEIMRELLAVNAPHDAKDKTGNVPLHTAIRTGDARTVAELLGRGVKLAVTAKNNAGATPLHLAAKLGHLRIARELLAVGARADAKDARGKMPADVVPRGHDELLELLRDAAGDTRSAVTPLPGYSRPTSASSAGGRLTPPRVSSPPPSTPPLRRSVVPGGTRPVSRASSVYGGTSVGSEVVADQIEKQGAIQRGQEKSLQQLNTKVDNLEGVVDLQREVITQQTEALASLQERFAEVTEQSEEVATLRAAQAQHAEALQNVQTTVFKRFEQLATDMRSQIGKLDSRLVTSETRGATHLGTVDALQIQVDSFEERLAESDRTSAGNSSAALPNVIRKVESLERRITTNERQRQMERQRDLNSATTAAESVTDFDTDPSPGSVRGFSETADGHRAMKKHAEMIGSLQKGLASLEARLVDYQDAVAVQMAAEAESPEYMTSLRSALDAANSEAGSGVSGDSIALASGEPSSTAMTAVLVALEGLTKEVARVRVRTAQLGDRGHTSDVRLTYVEDQVSRIKNKMKQLKGWFTLGEGGNNMMMGGNNMMLQQGPGSSRGTSSSKSRAPMFTDAAGGRLSERMVHNRHGSSGSLYSSRNSIGRSHSLSSSAIVRPIHFD